MLIKGEEKKTNITNGFWLEGSYFYIGMEFSNVTCFSIKKKWKSECKEEMIHKFQTIRLSFLEFQSLANVNIFLQSINTALNTTLNDTM